MNTKNKSLDMGRVKSLCSDILYYNDLATYFFKEYNILKGQNFVLFGDTFLKLDSPIFEAVRQCCLECLQKKCELCQSESFRLVKELSLLDCHW